MSDCGIVYVAVNHDRYVEEAFLSAASVKRACPGVSIVLFTDRPDHKVCRLGHFDSVERLEVDTAFDTALARGLAAKFQCFRKTPYQRTLYLDVDTLVACADFDPLFRLLDDYDIGMVEASSDDSYSRAYYGRPLFNTGVILYRKTARMWKWFEVWEAAGRRNFTIGERGAPPPHALKEIRDSEILRKMLLNDQLAMAETLSPAVNELGLAVTTLAPEWNYRGSSQIDVRAISVKVVHYPRKKAVAHAIDLHMALQAVNSERLIAARKTTCAGENSNGNV
jgi:hypothetical protein